MRLLVSALLAFGWAAPAAAQVRVAAPGSVSVIPAFTPALSPTLGASFTPSLTLPLATGLSAPSITPSLSFAPVPALAVSVIPAAATSVQFQPALVPAALQPGSAPSKHAHSNHHDDRITVTSLKDLGKFAGMVESAAAAKAFDGAAAKAALESLPPSELPLPLGAKSVSSVRVNDSRQASMMLPHTSNTEAFIRELPSKWDKIGWLDLRIYTDVNGGTFVGIDLTGRPELAHRLPEVQQHESAQIRKIQMYAKDLQLVIREEGKTPDLIVDGVVTEMKSLFPGGEFKVQLAHANEQVLEHAIRHHLAPGAASIDMTSRDHVPVDEILAEINEYAASGVQIGLSRVTVFAGKDRQVFVRAKDGRFDLLSKVGEPFEKTNARFLVPNTLSMAAVPDPETILREVSEPARRLRAAGVKATVTVYGSARIQTPQDARANLEALIKRVGKKPKRPEDRKALFIAHQAVEVSKYYEIARNFGRIVAENGGGEVALVTGGGPGIMEAANRGAFEAGGPSVGYNIILDKEQGLNKYATPGLDFEFEHFATRKMALRHGAMGLVYFPGGFGTMDELFEVLTLIQTRKMPRVPIVLIGEKSYWDKVVDFDEFAREGLISDGDLSLFHFADTAEGAWRQIVTAKR